MQPMAEVLTQVADSGVQPLSARQTLLWLDHELFPTAPYHTLVLRITLRGELDVPRLADALAQLVARHDALRSVVEVHAGQPRLRVLDHVPAPLERLDFREQPALLQDWLDQHAARPFATNQPMFKVVLVRLSEDEHQLVWLIDHLIVDGRSLILLHEELAAAYRGSVAAPAPPYLEYLTSEREYRASPRGQEHAAYWGSKLAQPAAPLALYGQTREHTSLGISCEWRELSAEQLRGLARLGEAPPFQLMTATLSRTVVLSTLLFAYLYRASGDGQLALALPIQNRSARFRSTIGLFMEQPIVRVSVDEDDTFRTLAAKVRSDAFESFRRAQYCSTDRGVTSATLNVLSYPKHIDFGGVAGEIEFRPAPACTRKLEGAVGDLRDTFAIQVHEYEDTGTVRIGLEFHRDTFSAEQRERAVEHLLRMLDALIANPDARLSSVDLVGEREREQLILWGRGPEPAQPVPNLLLRLRAQAARRAEHVALRSDELTLTYGEVEARSNQLARRLAALGVREGTRVGIYVRRGLDEVLTMLAVLKTGAAYVPLDPTHPPERVQLIIDDAQPQVIVTHRAEMADLKLTAGAGVLVLDESWPEILTEQVTPLEASESDQRLAYVLFTSGSTGRPKGVEITCAALANLLESMAEQPGLHEADLLLAITTITFDIAQLELLLPLWVGATALVASREAALDPRLLRALVEREPITVMQATPATWRLLVEAGFTGKTNLRMLCGGEALSPELAAALLQRGSELWNVYGPTETTVWSTAMRVTHAHPPIVIGRPILRTQVYVLDGRRQLVPIGVAGELCIGGAGVARGYRDRPDLTADRFVQDPFGAPGERIYRTGDLARFLPDGTLECLGRLDNQVKVRGFRIELGEIESVLRSVDGVRDAVVVARKDDCPDPRLVAYLIADAELAQEKLASAARARLPSYMHPSAYVLLPEYPLTPSGKVDRKRLPAPTYESQPTRGTNVLPRNDLELRVAAIWAATLKMPSVGVEDNFFDLGGTSPLAIEVLARVNAALGSDVPLRVLFEDPTVAGLVARLGERSLPAEPIRLALRRGDPDRAPLFCILGLNLYNDLAHALPPEITVYGLHVPTPRDTPGYTPPLVEQVARKYVELIRAERPHGPYHLAGLCFGGIVAYEVAQQLQRAGEYVATVSVFDAYWPRSRHIDLAKLARSLSNVERTRNRLIDLSRHALRSGSALIDRAKSRALRSIGSEAARGPTGNTALAAREPIDVLNEDTFVQAARYEKNAVPYQGPLLVFRARDRDDPMWLRMDWDLGWKHLNPGAQVFEVPGDHLGLVRQPNVQTIARVLAPLLQDQAPPKSSARPRSRPPASRNVAANELASKR